MSRSSDRNPGGQRRLDWFHADLRRRIRRFHGRLEAVAKNELLVAEVRAAMRDLPGSSTTPEELIRQLHATAAGRSAAAAVGRLLVERRMPAELSAWIAWVALTGENLPAVLAADYREANIGPHARHVREPTTGDTYLEIRVPADWSKKTIVAALPFLRDPSIFSEVEAHDGIGGRPRSVEPSDAVELARRFDATVPATRGGKRLAVKTWLARWQKWLDAEFGVTAHPRAAWLWRTTVKAAVESGTFVPAALETVRVRRLRRSS